MTSMRNSRARTKFVRLCALALVIFTTSCASGDGDPTQQSAEDSSPTTVTTASPTTAADDEPISSEAVGGGEVQTTERLPAAVIGWTAHRLELPAAIGPDVWLSHVGVSDAGLTAVAFAWDISPPVQTVISWTSVDGARWDRRELQLAPGIAMHQVVDLDGNVYGLGQQTNAGGVEPLAWSMHGAGDWSLVDLSSSGTDLTDVTLWSAASNSNVIVLGAERSLDEPRSTVSFDTAGLRFELNDLAGTYELTDVESGRVVNAGQSSDIFGWSNEGQAIYDIATGELLTVVPWEVWEQPDHAVSPLPIPVPADAAMQPLSIDWDGLRITIDEADDRYQVAEADTGTLITSGLLVDLFRGPAPAFVDSDTGEVVLSLSWDEWDVLMNEAYSHADGAHVPRQAEQFVLHSADGKGWVEVILGNGPDTQFDSLFAVGDEFFAATVEHGEFESTRSFHTSTNGTDWRMVERRPFQQVVIVGVNDEEMIGLSYEEGSSALMTSADGRSWATALQMAGEDDGGSVWLQLAATGGAGTAAIATVDPAHVTDKLTITVGSRTATFGAPGSIVEIVDAQTGEIVLEVETDPVEIDDVPYATYDDGATMLWSPSGELLMTISDADAFAAFDAQAAAYEDAVRQVVFITKHDEWFEADLPDLGDGFVAQLAVGDDVIVVGAINGAGLDGEVSPADTIRILVGTPQ